MLECGANTCGERLKPEFRGVAAGQHSLSGASDWAVIGRDVGPIVPYPGALSGAAPREVAGPTSQWLDARGVVSSLPLRLVRGRPQPITSRVNVGPLMEREGVHG
jgi:hypothetical protein